MRGSAARDYCIWCHQRLYKAIKEDGLDYCRLATRVRDDWDRALAAATREADAAHPGHDPAPTTSRERGGGRERD
jgi:hypothetical protein